MVESTQVDTRIDNTTVEIILQTGDSTTVPSGEVWKVNLSCYGREANVNRGNAAFRVNGVWVTGDEQDSGSGDEENGTSTRHILVGGDTIYFETENNNDIAGYINGFKV